MTLSAGLHGDLHEPTAWTGDTLVLTHGAGSNRAAPLLVAVAEVFSARGMLVLRCDLPFRQARASGPPRPRDAAQDRNGLRAAAMLVRARGATRVFLGGHSYGGRQASLLAAEEPAIADALLLLAYPLHPPARPAELRTGHFRQLRMPAFFVHGTRDPFGSIDELRAALAVIPGPTGLQVVAGAGHDLGRRLMAVSAATADEFLALTSRASRR